MSVGARRGEVSIFVQPDRDAAVSQSQVTATLTCEGEGWGGAGRRSKRRPAARFMTRAKEWRRHRISVKQVLKQAWVRHGYGGKAFPGCRHSPRRPRQRFASLRSIDAAIDAGDQSSSGQSSSSRIQREPNVDLEVAVALEDFSMVAGLAEDTLLCSEILCEQKFL